MGQGVLLQANGCLSYVAIAVHETCRLLLSLHYLAGAVPVARRRHSLNAQQYASMIAWLAGFAGYSSYCPTKWAVRGLADCLRNEASWEG